MICISRRHSGASPAVIASHRSRRWKSGSAPARASASASERFSMSWTVLKWYTYLACNRILQGKLQEGVAIGREMLGKSRQLHERAEAMGPWVLGMGLVEIGEYEEGLELCWRGTELARKVP